MTTTMLGWIRPWYPGGVTGHIYADCEQLLHTTPEPQEGAGWLNPQGDRVCTACAERHDPTVLTPPWDATCDTCDASMSEEDGDDSGSEDDAKFWQDNHKCEPSVRLIPPRPAAPVAPVPPPTVPDGQPALFDLKDAA
ncbi:hypothetical protein GCM10017559_08030 [Streptosporangium longisporum]|uniref:Uncharacterized protein n=1 Tax=Streptosporangium longisporum TaxID=46187 RepID=A0ABN3XTG3_9ACTN